MSFDRHAREHATTSDFGRTDAAPVGRRTLTQRHAVQMSDEERAASHAQLDAEWAGAIQRKEHGPTAGPSEDDRWGAGKVAESAHGRIIIVNIVGERTRIGIGLGKKQGVRVGMMGYVAAKGGMLCDFQIEEVGDRVAYAFVDTTPDGLKEHNEVVVNPPSLPVPAARQDMHARIVGVSVENGMTKILIGMGVRHGAHAGMKGYLAGDDGRRFTGFEVAEEHPGHCVAYVHEIVDTVRAHSQVVLNPSS